MLPLRRLQFRFRRRAQLGAAEEAVLSEPGSGIARAMGEIETVGAPAR